jgi:hypothetical protein
MRFTSTVVFLLAGMPVLADGLECLLENSAKVRERVKRIYEAAKGTEDPNPKLKDALALLQQVQEPLESFAERGGGREVNEELRSVRELRKLCREAMVSQAPPPTPAPGPKPAENAPADPAAHEAALKSATTALKGGSPGEVCAALSAVGSDKEGRLAAAAVLRLRTEADPQARAALVDLLRGSPAPRVAVEIQAGLDARPTAEFERDSAEILAGRPEEKAVVLLARLAFGAETRSTRESARAALSPAGPAAAAACARWLRHPEKRVRSDAIAFLAGLRVPAGWAHLTGLLIGGTDRELQNAAGIDVADRDAAMRALIDAGEDACSALVAALGQQSLKKHAAQCLREISGEDFPESDRAAWAGWWRKRAAERSGR